MNLGISDSWMTSRYRRLWMKENLEDLSKDLKEILLEQVHQWWILYDVFDKNRLGAAPRAGLPSRHQLRRSPSLGLEKKNNSAKFMSWADFASASGLSKKTRLELKFHIFQINTVKFSGSQESSRLRSLSLFLHGCALNHWVILDSLSPRNGNTAKNAMPRG